MNLYFTVLASVMTLAAGACVAIPLWLSKPIGPVGLTLFGLFVILAATSWAARAIHKKVLGA